MTVTATVARRGAAGRDHRRAGNRAAGRRGRREPARAGLPARRAGQRPVGDPLRPVGPVLAGYRPGHRPGRRPPDVAAGRAGPAGGVPPASPDAAAAGTRRAAAPDRRAHRPGRRRGRRVRRHPALPARRPAAGRQPGGQHPARPAARQPAGRRPGRGPGGDDRRVRPRTRTARSPNAPWTWPFTGRRRWSPPTCGSATGPGSSSWAACSAGSGPPPVTGSSTASPR